MLASACDSGSQKVQHFRESKPALRPLHATTFGVHAQNSSDSCSGRRPMYKSDEKSEGIHFVIEILRCEDGELGCE